MHSHLLLALQLAGLLLQASQLLLGLLQFLRGPFQFPGQLLVAEFQLGVFCPGRILVIIQGCVLAFQLQGVGVGTEIREE